MTLARRLTLVLLVAISVAGTTAGCSTTKSRQDGLAIFWTQTPHGREDEHGSIGRARLDGSGANGRFISGGKAPAGIALDGRYVYWARYGTGTIARAKLDGSEVNNRFITGADYPIGVAVDGKHIYWTNSGIGASSGTIGRANLDGSGVDQDFIKIGQFPKGLAVDGGHIYWTHRVWNRDSGSWSGNWIGRANLDGSDVEQHFIAASNKLTGVAVNGGSIYWANSGEDTIGRANLDGTAVDQRCLTPRNVPLGNVPEGIAVDSEHIYWTNYPANTIGRANLDGSAVNERFIVVKGVPGGIAVAPNRDAEPSASAGACVGQSEAPLLFGTARYMPGYYATGWGEVAPPIISNGGAAASGTIFQIRWSSWGGKVAVGRGLNPTYKPHGGYYRRPVVIELRASVIWRCNPGRRLVYTRFVVRSQVRPGGPLGKWRAWAPNMCIPHFQ